MKYFHNRKCKVCTVCFFRILLLKKRHESRFAVLVQRSCLCQVKGMRAGSAVAWCWCLWSGLKPHQAAVAPWAPVSQHAVVGTGQPACPRPQRHALRVTQVVLHGLRGPVHSVEHAPSNTRVGVTVKSLVTCMILTQGDYLYWDKGIKLNTLKYAFTSQN